MDPVHFLLVDDLEENLLSLAALLRRDGLVLLKARSGDGALELMLKYEIALALVDVQMPGLNGFQLAELMRGNERTRRIPIIFLTAGSIDGRRRFLGYEAGAVDYINKPIEPDILRGKADVFFELYRQRQQIAEQRDELQLHAEALREADRQKDDFLATLAHELRNPLAPLRYGLDILHKRPADDRAAMVRDMMDRQLVHLVRLIDDLLDISRVSRGKIKIDKQRIDIADVVRAAVEASSPLIHSARHVLSTELPDAPVWLDADLVRLAQVLNNLLNNAAKYTPDGGRIALSVQEKEDAVIVRVSDTGVGITPDMKARIFQLFAQGNNQLERARGGLGIGLALVKELVALHNGTIDVESPGLGLGSTFVVRLPKASVQSTAESAGEAAPARIAKRLKVLVVDDDKDVAKTAGWMLEEIGHDYRIEHDGRGALHSAREYLPDVILLDIGLPGMDGYAVCRAFRQDALFRETRIIAQTGWGQERHRTLASQAGFDGHLVKPASLGDLEQILSNVPS
jgi:signal transduction histidine kinase